MVAAALHRDGGCIAKPLVPQCGVSARGRHEPLTQGRGGDYLDLDNAVTLCGAPSTGPTATLPSPPRSVFSGAGESDCLP